MSFISKVIESAYRHGFDSEPDMEVGDLQEVVRDLWKLLTPAQRKAFASSQHWQTFIETWPTRQLSRVKSEAVCPKCESKQTQRHPADPVGWWCCEDCKHEWPASKDFSRAKAVRS